MNERYFNYLTHAINFQLKVWDSLFEKTSVCIIQTTNGLDKMIGVKERKDFYPTPKEQARIKKKIDLAKDTEKEFEKMNISYNVCLDVDGYMNDMAFIMKEEYDKHQKESSEGLYLLQSLQRSVNNKILFKALIEDLPGFQKIYFPKKELYKHDYIAISVTPKIDMDVVKNELDTKNFENIKLMRANSERCMDYINLFRIKETEDEFGTKTMNN